MEHDYAMAVEAEVEVEVEVEEEVAVKKEEVVVVDEEVLLPATTSKVLIRPITSRWEMVKMKDYLKLGRRRSREGFWTSCPVRLVMSGLQRSTLTTDQAAPLLGVNVAPLALRFMEEETVEEIGVKKEEVTEDNFTNYSDAMRGVKRKVGEAWAPRLCWVTPEVVAHLLVASFAAKDREVGAWEEPPALRPALAFYTSNVERVCRELDQLLASHADPIAEALSPLLATAPLQRLRAAAAALDRQSMEGGGRWLAPSYNYSRRRLEGEEDYWSSGLPRRLLADVIRGAVPAEVAAAQLGVTPTMVRCAAARTQHTTRDLTKRKYCELRYGTEQQFWEERSTVEALVRVREREVEAQVMAVEWGVARSEVVAQCGGVKTVEELEDERKLAELERFKARVARAGYVRKESQLEKQITLAERQQENLSDYEKMRLSNMKERQELLERLQFDKEKKEMLEERQKAMIFTPKEEVERRAPSARIKAKQEQEKVADKRRSSEAFTIKESWRLESLKIQQQRRSPAWVGQWVPLSTRKNATRAKDFCPSSSAPGQVAALARDIAEGSTTPRFVHPATASTKRLCTFESIYDLEEVGEACMVPQVEVGVEEVLDQHTELHTALSVLDSFSAEVGDVVEEARYSTSSPLVGLELVEESVVVGATITALASSWDLMGYGCSSGTVGLHIGATSLNWRPHGGAVTTLAFHGASLLSCSVDGAVRRSDLGRQAVVLEHGGEEPVAWMERRGRDSFLLASTEGVGLLDLRRRGVTRVVDLQALGGLVQGSEVAAHPSNPDMFSVCCATGVRIYDLRRLKQEGGGAVEELEGAFLSWRWNPLDPALLLAYRRASVWSSSTTVRAAVYSSTDLSRSAPPPGLSSTAPHTCPVQGGPGEGGAPAGGLVPLGPRHPPPLRPHQGHRQEQVTNSIMTFASHHFHLTTTSSSGQPAVQVVDAARGKVATTLELQPGTHDLLLHCHAGRPEAVVANSGRQGGLAIYRTN